MKSLVFLDFDRTLFNTDLFWADFAGCLANATGLNKEEIVKNYEDFCHSQSDKKLRYVDLDGFINKYQIGFKGLEKQVDKMLAMESYLYPDTAIIDKYIKTYHEKLDFAVLSFGQESMQNLKISRCNLPKNLPVYITQLAKVDFIKYYFASRRGVLVDDKLGQNLPDGWIEININRDNTFNKPKKVKSSLYQISNLGQLKTVLDYTFVAK